MSANNAQTNGKKSANSSAVNTPASTPVTNGNSSQTLSHSTPPPPNNNAPKYGTLVPNRIFVGGISANTTEGELLQLFSNYGTVKAAKIIQDRAGVSKGYGFITFESEDDAKRPLKDADNIVLRERKLNIAPAIKKQPFNRAFDASSPSTVAQGNSPQFYFPPSAGVPYFQGGVTYYQQPQTAPGDPNSQPTTVYQAPPVYPAQSGPPQAPSYPSMMFPHHLYMPQQYAMPPMPYDYNYYPNNGGAQFMVGGQNGPSNGGGGGGAGASQGGPMPPSSSPSRPPCYNAQQLQYAPDPIYYNMPVYGGPLDGAPVYPESLELAGNGGGYPEGPPYTLAEPSVQDLEVHSDSVDLQQHHPHLHHHQTAPPQPSVTYESGDGVDTTRQTKTPVVSLLSMEQHQDKDFVSMQGGRRVKPLQSAPPPPPPIMLPHYAPQNQHPPPPPPMFHYNSFNVRPHIPHHFNNNNNNNHKTANNNGMRETNGWRKPRNYNNNNNAAASGGGAGRKYDRNNDSSSRSSVRTDSNSSANAALDENRNDENIPTIISPIHNNFYHHHQHTPYMYNCTRTYQNSAAAAAAATRRPHPPKSAPVTNEAINKTRNNFAQSQQMRAGTNHNSSGQPTATTTTVMLTSVAAAARRNKRTTRRNVQAGGSLSEIGAGDAPLPNNDVTDTCKKMETLKM